MAKWEIKIDNFLGGYAPNALVESYPSIGNKNEAGVMSNMDLMNSGYISPGPGLSSLTNGTQAGVVSTLILGMTDREIVQNIAVGGGGNKLYQITPTTVTSDGTWPHTVDKAAVTGESIWGVCWYQGQLFYSYSHSGGVGDVGWSANYETSATFDDDLMSTIPVGADTLNGSSVYTVPYPMVVGGNNVMYIGHTSSIASYSSTTLTKNAFTLGIGSVVQDLTWGNDRLYISCLRFEGSTTASVGVTNIWSSVVIWDGYASNFDSEIRFKGQIGAIRNIAGTVYVFYSDKSFSGGYKLGYVNGNVITPLGTYLGELPKSYQVTEHKGFLLWQSSGLIWAYGQEIGGLPARLFQYADGGYSTVGGLASPFGTPYVSSWDGGANFRLAKFRDYETSCSYKTLIFDITSKGQVSQVEGLRINYELLASGARVDWSLVNNQGVTIYSDTISYAKATASIPGCSLTSAYVPLNGKVTENLRLEFSYSNGSTTVPVLIKSAILYGDN